MACDKRCRTGSCVHHQCEYSDQTDHGYECVELFSGDGHIFCEIGENCFTGCPYSYVPGDGSDAEKGAIAWNRDFEEERKTWNI